MRLWLNISAETSAVLDRWERLSGEKRGALARLALDRGIRLLAAAYRRKRRRLRDASAEAAAEDEVA